MLWISPHCVPLVVCTRAIISSQRPMLDYLLPLSVSMDSCAENCWISATYLSLLSSRYSDIEPSMFSLFLHIMPICTAHELATPKRRLRPQDLLSLYTKQCQFVLVRLPLYSVKLCHASISLLGSKRHAKTTAIAVEGPPTSLFRDAFNGEPAEREWQGAGMWQGRVF